MENLKKNIGQLIGAVLGIALAYIFGTYWFSDVRPSGILYKILYAVIVYVLIQGSALIGNKYIDRPK